VLHPQPMMQAMWELAFYPGDIHSVGLWSQDFGLWLEQRKSLSPGMYRYWYRFSILPDDPICKPKAPLVAIQLEQLERLVAEDGPRAVRVYVDPLMAYRKLGEVAWSSNAEPAAIEPIVRKVADLGMGAITVSVLDYYPKVAKRAAAAGVELRFFQPFREPDLSEMAALVEPIVSLAKGYGVKVLSCCERSLADLGVLEAGACVDGPTLERLFGPGASSKRDKGQRRRFGCGCTMALDVGRYIQNGEWQHKCHHDCLQCYARP
jgi:hypothetical protein